MSTRCLNMVTEIVLPPTQKSILRALAWRADRTFTVMATIRDVQADTGLGDSTVRRGLGMLVGQEYLTVMEATRGPKARSTYRLNPPAEGGMGSAIRPEGAFLPRVRASTPPSPPHSPQVEDGGSKGVTWLTDLYRLGLARSNPLTDRETERITRDFGTLDFANEIEKFVSYFQQPRNAEKITTWATYGRLRTWFGNARRWEEKRHEGRSRGQHVRPVGPEEVAEAYPRFRRASLSGRG